MKPYRHNGRGSLVLAITLPGVVGEVRRFRKATGTHDPKEVERIRAWLLELHERTTFDILTLEFLRTVLTTKTETLAEQWRKVSRGRAVLGVGKYRGGQPELRPTLQLWLDSARLSPSTQRDRHYWLHPFTGRLLVHRFAADGRYLPSIPKGAPLAALVTSLSAMRQMEISGGPLTTRSEFRKARAAVMAFFRDLPFIGHGLIADGLALELHAEARKLTLPRTTPDDGRTRREKRDKQHFEPSTARALADKMGAVHGAALWALFVTGMNPREYFGEPLRNAEYFAPDEMPDNQRRGVWEMNSPEYHVRIRGTKRSARDRKVPDVWPEMPRATTTYFGFAKVFRLAQADVPVAKRFQPYDLRRGFAVACVRAGLTRSRRMGYMGHVQTSNVQDLYEQEAQSEEWLKADRTKLRRHFGKPPHFRVRQEADK
jgi:hypothetical protein